MAVKIDRQSYARLKKVYEIPNLIMIQVDSYSDFLQLDVNKTKRKKKGLESVLREVFPLLSLGGEFELEYLY